MSEFVGKICPFCRTKFIPEDSVIICTMCGMPHHEDCWHENRGCSTFGCSEASIEIDDTDSTNSQSFDDSEVLNDVQDGSIQDEADMEEKYFSSPIVSETKFCRHCQRGIVSHAIFCPYCGQKEECAFDHKTRSVIDHYNATITAPTKKKKSIWFFIFIPLFLIIIGVSGVLIELHNQEVAIAKRNAEIEQERKEREAAIADFKEKTKQFLELSSIGSVNLKNIGDSVHSYWNVFVYNPNSNYKTVGDAINAALNAKISEVSKAVSQLNDLRHLSEQLSENRYYTTEMNAVMEKVRIVLDAYYALYDCVTDPAGNYNTFKTGFDEKVKNFNTKYKELESLINQ